MAPAQTVQGNEECGLAWAQADHRGNCPTTSGAAKTENACTFGAAPLQGCKAHGTCPNEAWTEDKVSFAATPAARHQRVASVATKLRTNMLSVAKAMGKEALCAARPLHRGFCTPPSRHDSSAEGQAPLTRAAQSAHWLGFGTQGGWALEAWRLRSAPHYSASACACRPSPPASSRVQDQGHGHRAREAHCRGVQ